MTTKTDGPFTPADSSHSSKSLKDQNRWQLWVILATNTMFLYGVIQANAIKIDGVRSLFTDSKNLIPAGLALVLTTVINGVLSVRMKNRLVFLRWHHALPGHRAFSVYALRDPRINDTELQKLCGGTSPVQPSEQNKTWYQIYRSVENDHAVRQVHRDYLLLRDYAGISALLVVCFGVIGLRTIHSVELGLFYLLLLVIQYALVRQAASNYGIEFVTTVLARKCGWTKTTTTRRRKPKGTTIVENPKL
jgi:hypothetical protein